MNLPGYDAWKTNADADDPNRGGSSVKAKFVCDDCGWLGANEITAREHHHDERHHRMRDLRTKQPVAFACCPELAATGTEL